ncbi:hypothetical protein ES707_15829 [subsurface metagenome]
MKRVCYWCSKHMGEKGDDHEGGVLHSICDGCYRRMGLDERLPELLWAIAALREQNGGKEQNQTLGVLTTAQG